MKKGGLKFLLTLKLTQNPKNNEIGKDCIEHQLHMLKCATKLEMKLLILKAT